MLAYIPFQVPSSPNITFDSHFHSYFGKEKGLQYSVSKWNPMRAHTWTWVFSPLGHGVDVKAGPKPSHLPHSRLSQIKAQIIQAFTHVVHVFSNSWERLSTYYMPGSVLNAFNVISTLQSYNIGVIVIPHFIEEEGEPESWESSPMLHS